MGLGKIPFLRYLSLLSTYHVKTCRKTETVHVHFLTEKAIGSDLTSVEQRYFPTNYYFTQSCHIVHGTLQRLKDSGNLSLAGMSSVQSPEDTVWVILTGNILLKSVTNLMAPSME